MLYIIEQLLNLESLENLGNKHYRTELDMSASNSALCVVSVGQYSEEIYKIISEPVESESNNSCGSLNLDSSDSSDSSDLDSESVLDSETIKVEGEVEPDPRLEELDSLLELMVFIEDRDMLSRGIAVVYPTSIQAVETEELEGFEAWREVSQTRETEWWQKLISDQPDVATV